MCRRKWSMMLMSYLVDLNDPRDLESHGLKWYKVIILVFSAKDLFIVSARSFPFIWFSFIPFPFSLLLLLSRLSCFFPLLFSHCSLYSFSLPFSTSLLFFNSFFHATKKNTLWKMEHLGTYKSRGYTGNPTTILTLLLNFSVMLKSH